MLTLLLSGAAVSFVNFGVHGAMTGLVILATRHTARRTDHLHAAVRTSALLMVTMALLMTAHVIEISVWALFLHGAAVPLQGGDAFEFAFENFTALGYGDVLATQGWRLIGPVTSLNGLLLIGWSVALVFEVLRMADIQVGRVASRKR